MTKSISTLILDIFCVLQLGAQTVFHTEDIQHFYQAFDSVQTTIYKQKQIDFVQKIYLDQGSLGVKYAIEHSLDDNKIATAMDWVALMKNTKEKLIQIRPFVDNLPNQMKILVPKFQYFKAQYPDFQEGNVYFIVGLGIFGGRPEAKNLFIGCEIIANEKPDWAVNYVLHEYVHTLQKRTPNALLAHCLNEGAADFIAETINQKSLSEMYPNGHINFGNRNEKAVWKDFKKFMPSNEKGRFFDWLYGAKGRNVNGEQMKDLGYFVGYKICKSHYDNATDKKQAIKEIIEMDVSTDEKARDFLLKSGYVHKKDLKFVQKLEFKKVIEVKKGQKLIQYGYKIEKEFIVFEYDLPKSSDKNEVLMITVAGSFNSWNPKNLAYKMTNTKDNHYEFRLPIASLTEKHNEFKFVVNGDSWQFVPENAKNTQNGNLTLEMK